MDWIVNKLNNTLGKLMIPDEGRRKFVYCFWVLCSAVCLTLTGHVTGTQVVEVMKWAMGIFAGGNGIERISDALATKGKAALESAPPVA